METHRGVTKAFIACTTRNGGYHQGLPNIMKPFGATSQGEEVATTSISTQQTRGPIKDRAQGNAPLRPPLGTINIIFTSFRRTGYYPSRVMSIAKSLAEDSHFESKRASIEICPSLSFLDEDKIGTIQLHDDTLVITLRIGGMM